MKLLFIHGAGYGKEVWEYQTRHFAGSEAVALPGHPDGKLCSNAEEYADWLKGYISQNGYQDVVLVGHSFGGTVCQVYGVKYGDELKALVLIGTGARMRVHPDMLDATRSMIDDEQEWRKYVKEEYGWAKEEDRQALVEARVRIRPAVLLNDLEACDKFDIMGRIGEIKVPALAICGSEDWATPPKYAHYLADKIPGASAVIIEGAAHLVMGEKPGEVNRAIEKFLSGLS